MSVFPFRIEPMVKSPGAIPTRTLTLVPNAPPEPPPTLPSFSPFFRWLGGIGFFISALWEGREVYTALRQVPSQIQWLPGAPIDPAILTDPLLAAETARQRFGQMSDPALRQLYEVRKHQAVPLNPLADPEERRLLVPGKDGEWVKVPLDGQSTGAMILTDWWQHGDTRALSRRATDEHRLIDVELGRRNALLLEPKKDTDRIRLEQYLDYVQQYLEAVRKRANGEYVPLPEFTFSEEPTPIHLKCHQERRAMNSATPPNATPDQKIGNTADDTGLEIDKAVVAKRYDGYSADYEGHSKKMGANMAKVVLQYLGPHIKPHTHLLDVAGGDGLATSLLNPSEVAITIIDISLGLLHAAKKNRPNITETIRWDFDNTLPLDADTFDYTTCISALEFANDLRFTLRELLRVTKKGGLVLFTSDRLDPSSAIQNGKIYIHDPTGFFSRRYTTNEVHRVIETLGGNIIDYGIHNAYELEGQWIQYDYFLVMKI